MPDLLIYGDTIRSPELRHEVPVPVPDAFIYAEKDGDRYVFVGSLEIPRIEGLNGIVTVPLEDLGIDELVASGVPWHESERQVVLRACRKIGLESAVTPRAFPLEKADFLRANGISLEPDGEIFDKRRRTKNASELAGIRRAQAGAERAMGVIRDRLREGGNVTCEELQGLALQAFSESGVIAPDMVIVSHGEQTAIGHEPGHGPISERRGGHRRPVSAGSRLRLLRRHDADVLHGRAAGGARPLPRPRQGGARPGGGRDSPGHHREGAPPHDL